MVFDLPADDAFRMLKDARRLIRQRNFSVDIPRKVLAAGLAARSVARPIYEYVANGRQYVTTARPQVTVISEQAPDPESRVALSNERDALGMRKSRITWKLSDLTAYSVRLFATALSEQLLRTGIGQLQLRPWIRDVNSEWRSEFRDYFHHMGTARMSDDPRAGVVDRDCRVHGIRNLYVAGSAVFPTSGHANPTFTAIALALRIADRLKETRV